MKKIMLMMLERSALMAAILCLAFSCSKQEIVSDDSIGDSAAEGQAEAEAETEPDDYISPDQFNLVEMEFGADADAEEGAKGGLSFSMIEESLDDEDEATRTSLTPDPDPNVKTQYITWNEGDGLKVYYYKGESNFTKATIKHGGSSSSTLTARVNDSDKYYYAFYPYSGFTTAVTYEGDATYAYGAIQVTIPSTITIPDGTTDNFAYCHMAVGKASKTDQQFVFSNVGSYMKLVVANTTATAITIQATNTSDKIVGTFTVPFASSGLGINAAGIAYGACSSSVTVNLPTGRTGNITVYVPLLPGVNFSNGFRIRYEYGDDKDHPGFAYVKRTSGARTNRQVDRKGILNFATASVPTLDERIRENYYVKTGGTKSDVDVTGAGANWANALNVTGLVDLIEESTQKSADNHDRAWMLDGATIHMAAGSYYVWNESQHPDNTNKNIKMQFDGYDHSVKITFIGRYPAAGGAPRDSTNNVTTFTGNDAAGIFEICNQTDITFDGLTFSNASFSKDLAALNIGSGSAGTATVALQGCSLVNNANTGGKGAAMYVTKSAVTVNNCTFSGNSASNSGSCIHMTSSATDTLRLNYCKFDSNQAGTGGAISLDAADKVAKLDHCTISANHSNGFGGAAYIQHGTLLLSNCTVTNNYARTVTGTYGGGVVCIINKDSFLNARSCTFKGNSVQRVNENCYGGVLYVDRVAAPTQGEYVDITFDRCLFDGNSSPYYAGVMYMWGETFLKLNKCLFKNNSTWKGGLIQLDTRFESGDTYKPLCLAFLNDVTFYNNTTTTPANPWGTIIDGSRCDVCMNNVTSYGNGDNYSGTYDGNVVGFNSDGGWLITNSTLIERLPTLVRSNGYAAGAGFHVTCCNNIFISTQTVANVAVIRPNSGVFEPDGDQKAYFLNRGYNVLCYTDSDAGNAVPVDTDLTGITSLSSGAYSEFWNDDNYRCGAYTWTNNLSRTPCPASNLSNTMGSWYPRNKSGVPNLLSQNIGYAFYEWTRKKDQQAPDTAGAWRTDGRALSRRDGYWWPGAYDPSGGR